MAQENLMKYTNTVVLACLLIFSLLVFASGFIKANNPSALGDDAAWFNSTQENISASLYELDTGTDVILNITSKTNPEVSNQGSQDSVASSFKYYQTSKGLWDSSKSLIGNVFSGAVGKMLLVVISGMIAFGFIYYITRLVRSGN
jgi:hypothetical protein